MRITRIASLYLAALFLTSSAIAQTGDWQAVQNLPGGTPLKVKLKHGHTFGHCEFMGATDDMLRCEFPGLRYRSAHYRRSNIKGIYLVHNARAIGFGVGAVSGVIIGAAATPGPAAGRELFAVIDGTLLGGVGFFIGSAVDPFFHGKAVYLSSKPAKNNRRPSPSPQNPNPPATEQAQLDPTDHR